MNPSTIARRSSFDDAHCIASPSHREGRSLSDGEGESPVDSKRTSNSVFDSPSPGLRARLSRRESEPSLAHASSFHTATVVLACIVLAFIGCGSKENVAVVTGVVKLDGKPFGGASVTFATVEGGKVSSAETADDGTFSLTTRGNGKAIEGAPIGINRVAISALDVKGGASEAEQDELGSLAIMSGKPVRERSRLPEDYGDFRHSGLTFEVKADAENFAEFDLKSKRQ